jgi:3-hydroxyisobutyrate dehydrogenase
MKAGFMGLGHLGRAMAGRLASRGVDLILWNRSPEKAADLASGEKEAYQRGLSYLEKLAASIFYLGEPGLATRMKLVNNLILGSFMAAISEAVALGEAAGVEKATVLDILAAGAGASGVLNAKKDKLLREDFSPQFQSALIYKDLHYLQDLAFQLKKPVFLTSAVKEMYGLTYARGEETLDFSALYRILKESS